MEHLDLLHTKPETAVATAVRVLQAGGLVIFPTETTYGAGVLATSPAAVAKLLKYKARREGKPLSIAVTDLAMARQYVEVNESAERLYQRYLPGPLTVISKDLGLVAPGIASEFGTVGIRIPAYPLVLEIVRKLGAPITATSANASGEKRPYTVADILGKLTSAQTELIDLVLDAGQLPANPPSTIIDTTLSAPVIFRRGDVQLGDPNKATTIISDSPDMTRKIAKRLMLKYWSRVRDSGLVFALHGSLGAGKTEFTKGVAEYLGIQEVLTSPTYTYLESYNFRRQTAAGQLHHWDWWRLDVDHPDLDRLEVAKTIGPNKVTVIEWASQALPQLKALAGSAALIVISLEDSPPADHRLLEIFEPEDQV